MNDYDDDDDDDVRYAEIVASATPEERAIQQRSVALSPVENGGHGLLKPLDLSTAARAAIELLNLPPSILARLFRPIRRRQAVADTQAAAEVMGHARRLVNEYDLMRRDISETNKVLLNTAWEMDTRARNHHLDVELDAINKRNAIEAAKNSQQRHRQIRQRGASLLSGAAPSAAVGSAAVGFTAPDELSNRARVATLKGIASLDADTIADPYVAYAALAFASKLESTEDEEDARTAAFNDVREMLGANAFTAKDAIGFVTSLKLVRAETKKKKNAKAGLGWVASAVRGDG